MRRLFSRRILPVALISGLALGSIHGVTDEEASAHGKAKKEPEIRNVIFMIGDGMGVSYTSAYRYVKDNSATNVAKKTAFDKYLVGQQMTYPDDPTETITDSAAAATAMSTGVKTYNAAIAVDKGRQEVKTVLEAAKESGRSTGLVATSEITHATPASFGAHDENRKNMNGIADDYYKELINGQHKVDVLLGGGQSYFIRPDVDWTKAFQKDGYSYVTDKQQLLKDKNKQVLGLFAKEGLPKMIDRTVQTPSLKEMTDSAITRLNRDKDGFFLMVEGSQIDWAGHDNDIVGAMSEMKDFEAAFDAAIKFAKKDKHTLVVATADHSTGGLSIGANGVYDWQGKPVKAAKRTPDFMADAIIKGADVEATLTRYIDQQNVKLTKEEIESVQIAAKSQKVATIDDAIEAIFNSRTHTAWTTGGHTGEDVPVYAYGPGKARFAGQIDNTDQARIIFDLLN